MIKIQFEQLVEDYYYDRLDAEARDAFKTRMIVDSVFAEQVERYTEALDVLHIQRDATIKERFKQKERHRRQMALWHKIARFAAIILLTIGIPLTFMNYLSDKKQQTSAIQDTETLSSAEEIVIWIGEVVGEWDEVLSSTSFSSESYDEIMSHYSFSEETDFSDFQQFYDYITVGTLPDLSPEIIDAFSAILATNSDSVINLLQFMLEADEEEDLEQKKLSEAKQI